jgi:hypothetical protein
MWKKTKWYRQKRDSGMCARGCGNAARPGKCYCEECGGIAARECMRRYNRLKKNGLCTRCGEKREQPDKVACDACLKKSAEAYHRSIKKRKGF